ncbi:MAG: sulfite oxidase [Singulisphaera sp.]
MTRRRDFLLGMGAFPLGAVLPRVRAGEEARRAPGLVVRGVEPDNLEFPFASLDSFLIPNERFYVRSHFAVPRLEAASWRMEVAGAVERPSRIGLDDLKKMPSRTITAMLECSGNGRIFLVPKAKGTLWETGAVGNAEWTGVPLAAVLERAGLKEGALEVVLEGADKGRVEEEPKSPGEIHFARSVPLEKARRDVLLAYQMNGENLSPEHGSPLRAIVPGWYGMASIKWLSRILVVDRPFAGYFQTLDYSYFERRDGLPSLVATTENEVKSQVARPARHEAIPGDSDYRVHGAAWAGESEVRQVEVSTDGGKTWAVAKLVGESIPYAWRLWEWTWRTPKQAGPRIVMARATDRRGRVQPMKRDPDRRNGMISHVLPVEVEVS